VILNQKVPTNTEAMANRPDRQIKNDEEKTCLLIVVAIPANRNVTQKDEEKEILKYKSLGIMRI
jgi:vacuolar-type H+-ATPase subunit F/Vma7